MKNYNEIIDSTHIGYEQIYMNSQVLIGLLTNDIIANANCSSHICNHDRMPQKADTRRMRPHYAILYTYALLTHLRKGYKGGIARCNSTP